jgi:hypothetical protein
VTDLAARAERRHGLSPGYLGKLSPRPEKIGSLLLDLPDAISQRLRFRVEDRLHTIRQLYYRVGYLGEPFHEFAQLFDL